MQQPKPSPTVPAGVRATLTLLARIHADLDASAQSGTAARSSSAEHAEPRKRRVRAALGDLPRAS